MAPSATTDLPRVLILTAYYFPFQGGIETHARTLAAYLSQSGARVVVVTRRVDGSSASLEAVDGIPVHRVRPAGPRTGLRKWAMILPALIKILRLRREFDVIYCPGYQGIGIAAIVAGKLLRRPVVLRSGNVEVLRGGNWNAPLARWHISPSLGPVRWLKAAVRRLYMSADAFVCNCRDIEIEAIECGVPRSRIHYLPNAVDVDRYRPAAPGEKEAIRVEEAWPPAATICLYVGRLSREKGVMELLDAWRQMAASGALLVLIGPDMSQNAMDSGPAARRYVSEHGMGATVRFYGESADTARLLRAADLYVQPSHYEAFSNAVIEAMATGLPLVASGVGGILDCVVDGENGLLCPPRSSRDLARQLSRLVNEPALRARLGASARGTVVQHFERTAMFQRFGDLFAAVGR